MPDGELTQDRLFDRVGGWLFLPAYIHPLVGIAGGIMGIVETMKAYNDLLPIGWKIFIIGYSLFCLALSIAWLVSPYLAGTLSPSFPKFYIWLVVINFVIPLMVMVGSSSLLGGKFEADDYKELGKSLLAILVWVPYMLVSKRVKATFYGVPYPEGRPVYQSVTEPLRQAGSLRPETPKPAPPQNMTERLGLVLYWLCVIIAAPLILAGLLALINPGGEKIVGVVCLVFAAIAYGLGRAIRYVVLAR